MKETDIRNIILKHNLAEPPSAYFFTKNAWS